MSVRRKYRANDIVHKYIASETYFPNKIYLETPRGEFRKRFYNHNISLKNESKRNDTTLEKYVWDLKLKHNVTPTFIWHILKYMAPYSNITDKCRLCIQEKDEILSYPSPDNLLHKRSKLILKCHVVNKFLLANYEEVEWYHMYEYLLQLERSHSYKYIISL